MPMVLLVLNECWKYNKPITLIGFNFLNYYVSFIADVEGFFVLGKGGSWAMRSTCSVS